MIIFNNVDFETQYTFPDLLGVGGRKLRFDFAIFKNEKLFRLVEFNGAQHYEKPEGSWGKQYEATIENDNRKKEYCESKNIDLKIIRYDEEYDISDIIE